VFGLLGAVPVGVMTFVLTAYWIETKSLPHRSESVIRRMRALPFATWRSTRRVFSFDRSVAMTGRVRWRRSGSRRIAPVVKRTRFLARFFDSKRGKPTRRPLRVPCLDADRFCNARTASAIPAA